MSEERGREGAATQPSPPCIVVREGAPPLFRPQSRSRGGKGKRRGERRQREGTIDLASMSNTTVR